MTPRPGKEVSRPALVVTGPAEPGRGDRNRYADLLRLLAIGLVVAGHWLLTDITFRRGRLSGLDALPVISWSGWATLFFQVMPVFFVVGGFANATSWAAHHERGESWSGWVRDRALRLLWPAAAYVAVMTAAAELARLAGVSPGTLAQAGWLVALQLWFLPVYLVLIALTPLMLAAHRRWGLAVPAVMALAAAAVSAATAGPRVPVIGYANYVLVWGSMHQWGFAWRDGTLTRSRWRPYALATGGAAILAGLLAWSPFPVNMIGNGTAIGNTTPPSIALLAFAAAQTGLILAAAPVMTRMLARPRLWHWVNRLNATIMNVYLWHMVPVIIVAAALYPTGIAPQPGIGSAQWWELRPAWLAVLAVVLVALIAAVTWLERPMLRLPMGPGSAHQWTPALLLGGIAAASFALTKLAIGGFAPGGSLPLLILACYAGGLALTLLSGRPAPGPERTRPAPGPERTR